MLDLPVQLDEYNSSRVYLLWCPHHFPLSPIKQQPLSCGATNSLGEQLSGLELVQAAAEPLLDDGLKGARVLHPLDEPDIRSNRNHLVWVHRRAHKSK